MLKALSTISRPLISLIPCSGVQFVDFGFDLNATPKLTRSFWEELQGNANAEGKAPVTLHSLHPDPETGELINRATGKPAPADDVYSFNKVRGLEVFCGRWVPVPVLRVRGKDAQGNDQCRQAHAFQRHAEHAHDR